MFDIFGGIAGGLAQQRAARATNELYRQLQLNERLMAELWRQRKAWLVMLVALTPAQKNAPTGPRLSQQTLRMFPRS